MFIICPKKNAMIDYTNCTLSNFKNTDKDKINFFITKVCTKHKNKCPNEKLFNTFCAGWDSATYNLSNKGLKNEM